VAASTFGPHPGWGPSYTTLADATPSRHATGIPYRWVSEVPIAKAPSWLAVMLRREPQAAISVSRPARHPGGAAGRLVRYVLASSPGSRNNRLFWALCRAAEDSPDEAQIYAIAMAGMEIGLSATEVENTVRSALRTCGWGICAA
jgi:hypothetical protein